VGDDGPVAAVEHELDDREGLVVEPLEPGEDGAGFGEHHGVRPGGDHGDGLPDRAGEGGQPVGRHARDGQDPDPHTTGVPLAAAAGLTVLVVVIVTVVVVLLVLLDRDVPEEHVEAEALGDVLREVLELETRQEARAGAGGGDPAVVVRVQP